LRPALRRLFADRFEVLGLSHHFGGSAFAINSEKL
jgi:hypothetical protein